MEDFDTPRLRLRLLHPADEALYCALYTDPGVMTHVGPPLSAAAASRGFSVARRRNEAPDGAERRWSVRDLASGEAVGLLALLRDPSDPGNAELGVMLLPAAQGRGFARELNDAVAARAFAPGGWGLHRVWARHAAGHDAAAGALGASGFQPGPPEGTHATVVLTRKERS
ncbi:MAG TPA: GNAT family N-acetyltransferase [Xanthomonadaceae bacterium]|nr:GNAT family N-acetyltransferase [Xanthomonadaceae bacterium]